eukprot:symbB.v1.2.022675.t1/scaffold1992.1/size93445/6
MLQCSQNSAQGSLESMDPMPVEGSPETLAECLSTECPVPVEAGLPARAAVTTLTQNVLGSGVLALPYAMCSAGILGGLALLIFVYLLSVFTINKQIKGYYGAAQLTAGRRTAMWAEIWVLCTNVGLCISYVIVLGDFSFALAQKFGFAAWTSKEECMAVLVVCICWPLSCAPSLGFLRWMSMLGLLSVLFCALVAGVRYWDGSYFPDSGPPSLSSFNPSSFGQCFPILVGAFGAHTNIPLLYKELAPGAKTPNWGRTEAGKADFWKMIKVITISLTIACCVYGWVGIIVYATFGFETKGDFSDNFRPDDQLLAAPLAGQAILQECLEYAGIEVVLRLTMACAICSSFALMMISARTAACNLFLYPLGFVVTPVLRTMAATCLTAICLGVAVVAKQIDTVLAYNGSVFATPVCFVAPPLMYLCLPRQSRRRSSSCLCALSAFAGLAFGLYGFWVTLHKKTIKEEAWVGWQMFTTRHLRMA